MAEIIDSVPLPASIKAAIGISVASVAADQPDGLFPPIPGFEGVQIPRSTEPNEVRAYDTFMSSIYSASSHQIDHDMFPGLIVKPKHDQDVVTAIKYAKAKNLKISIKSGGHQYSGACATSGPNIMMDLGMTYYDDLRAYEENGVAMVHTSVSQPLKKVNTFLCKNNLFVPHGQCSTVHIGGHAQTGGYGNLARGFGLFGDHVRKIRMFDHSGNERILTKDAPQEEDRRLFNAVLGGSPGNFGVVTHYHVQVYKDSDYMYESVKPHYFWGFFIYTKETLQKCLDKVAEMADNPDFDHNYDLCVSVLSSSIRLLQFGPDAAPFAGANPLPKLAADAIVDASTHAPDAPLLSDLHTSPAQLDAIASIQQNGTILKSDDPVQPVPVPLIAVYAQWCPFSENDRYDPKFFDDLINAGPVLTRVPGKFLSGDGAMSDITSLWLFHSPREFDHPYDKRTYLTTSTSLGKDKWVPTVSDQIDKVVKLKIANLALFESCFLAVQIQCYGGNKSKYRTNKDNGTSYSWRDSTVVQVLDCFYRNGAKGKALAEGWQAENDRIMKGKGSVFGEQDRRVLWGSYGDWDMKKSWKYYYNDEAHYKKVAAVRAIADPDGTFTANPFAVEAIRQ